MNYPASTLGIGFAALILAACTAPIPPGNSTQPAPSPATPTLSTANETRYGILTFLLPLPMSDTITFPYEITFTGQGPVFASIPPNATPGSAPATSAANATPDLIYDGVTFTAPHGIIAMAYPLGAKCPGVHGTMAQSEAAECYANYLRANPTSVSAGGYGPSVASFDDRLIFLQTANRGFVLLQRVGRYIGGYDRDHFFWAYNPDGSAVFFTSK